MSSKADTVAENNVKKEDEKMEGVETGDGPEKSEKVGKKRSRQGNGPMAKRKKRMDPALQQPKNALMQLNEVKPGLKYVVESEEGPPHNPVFVVSVEVNDEKFIGKGRSKQLAKHAAAEAALKSFVQFRNMSEAFRSLSRETYNVHMDFTDDNVEAPNTGFGQCQEQEVVGGIGGGDASLVWQNRMNNKLRKIITEVDKKNPVTLLNEIRPGLTYTLAKENPLSTDQRFVMTIDVDGEIYEGAGQNKKAAKAAVARAVLSQKFQVNFSSLAHLDPADMELFEFPQNLSNKIGKLLHDTVDELIAGIKEAPKWKVLAGVVMTKDEAMEDMQVICIGTGTKNIKGENMSLNGVVINDCHAEVVARRCLKDFFFTQLELHMNRKADQSIFEKTPEGKFKLRPHHKFHFYVTAAPCGDAGIYSIHDEDIVAEFDMEHQGLRTGVLRTKLEAGNGTVPVESASEQKVVSIKEQTSRYHIMSCSDKMTTWNVLGVQGSLLNYFIDPIYFDTIIIGRHFNRAHMLHSMFKRIERTLVKLPAPFLLHKPKMTSTSTWATRHLVQPPQVSVNWTCGLKSPEFVLAVTGKVVDGNVSRLAKRSLFQRFIKIHDTLLKPASKSPTLYGAAKKASPNYQQAKEVILKAFATNGLGIWKRKPAEQEWFDLTF